MASSLAGDILYDADLISADLAAVRVARVNHQIRQVMGFDEGFRGRADAFGIVIRFFAAAENQMAVVIAGG